MPSQLAHYVRSDILLPIVISVRAQAVDLWWMSGYFVMLHFSENQFHHEKPQGTRQVGCVEARVGGWGMHPSNCPWRTPKHGNWKRLSGKKWRVRLSWVLSAKDLKEQLRNIIKQAWLSWVRTISSTLYTISIVMVLNWIKYIWTIDAEEQSPASIVQK